MSKEHCISFLIFFTQFLYALPNDSNAAEKKGESIRVSILVEHDGWRIEGLEIAGRGRYRGRSGQWFIGAHDKIGRVWLQPSRSYVIEGMMGWKVSVSINESGRLRLN